MKAFSLRLSCSFCSKSQKDVRKLIANPAEDSYICEECVQKCTSILADAPIIEKPKTAPTPSPRSIKTFLDHYVIGQDNAKEILSVAVYNHYKRLAHPVIDGVEIDKSNILLYGPTGVGKTLLVQSVARLLDVPLAIADATTLTEAGYIGDDVENVIGRLLQVANYDVKRAERGIIFLDEIDKKRTREFNGTSQRDATGEGVQQALLTLLEGSDRMVPVGSRRGPNADMVKVNTRNILFILGGAFNGLDRIVEHDLNGASGIGFGANLPMTTQRLLHKVTPEHLIKYGLIPELVGRIPVITALDDLDEAQLMRILTEPRNAIIKQYEKMFSIDGIKLEFRPEALQAIATLARARKTNGRALRSVLERCLQHIQYNLPELAEQGVERVVIHAATITEGTEPEVTYVVRKGKVKL